MTLDEERLRASEARKGAAFLRRHAYARAWEPETLAFAMGLLREGRDMRKPIPEAAMDWPIYRAALAYPHPDLGVADFRKAGRK